MTEIVSDNFEKQNMGKAVEEYIGGRPTAIYIMSPGVSKGTNEELKSATMLSGDLLRGDTFGYTGGSLRLWAAANVYDLFPEGTTVVTSSVTPATEDTEIEESISHAAVQEREFKKILEKRGLPLPHLIKEENSISTVTEMAELVMMTIENDWTGEVVAITNDYHLPRSEKMFDLLPTLLDTTKAENARYKDFGKVWEEFQKRVANGEVSIAIRGAETILSLTDPKFKNAIERAFASEPWKSALERRKAWEEKGMQALDEENYEPKLLKKDEIIQEQ